MEFKNIEQLVKYVNVNLKKGESVTKVERALGLGKDTLRKKLNRAKYKFNKELREFVLQDNTAITQKAEKQITQGNTDVTQGLSEEDIQILKRIIKNYKELEVEPVELQGKIITRSFRTYENVIDMFIKYCNNNNLVQKDAIAQAMIDFISR